jgi:lipoprotein-anchoring transpeptidase ErfK/SrfK
MRRRLLLAAAAVTAAAVPLGIVDGVDTKPVQAHKPAATARAASTAAAAYAQARRNGQPIAVLADRTRLRATPGGRTLAAVPAHTEWGAPTVLAATAERGGWLRVIATELPNGARGWIPESAVATVLASPWKLEADLSRRLMTVRRNGRAVRRFRVAVGKPSTPTPTGRFGITDKLHFTSRSAAYGPGAIALTGHQTHIEPGWKGGTRLAIHGTADQASIGQAASSGCLRASDSDVRWLVRHTYLGSIVEIRP